MDNRNLIKNIPEPLRKKIAKGEVVPFIGAGISMGADLSGDKKMPSYKELLNNLLEVARNKMNEKHYLACKDLIHEGKHLDVAELIERVLNTGDLYTLLRSQLNHLQPKPSVTHEILNLFDFEIILTSNYDRILETSLYPTPEVVTYRDSVSLAILRQEKTPFIFKIHGDLTRPDTIILGWSKYQELQSEKNENTYGKALKSFIQSILLDKTILFLGCSFDDSEYAEYFFNFSKEFGTTGIHYALVEKGKVAKTKQAAWYKNMGVKMIEYIPDEEYSQVWEFLASLKPQEKNYQPKQGETFENFYLLRERSDYLKQQLHTETTAKSCRFLTPGITNGLAPISYIKATAGDKLDRFKVNFEGDFDTFKNETLALMVRRAENMELKLKEDGFEFRAIFLLEEAEKEMKEGTIFVKRRYDYIFELLKKYPERLQLRAYQGNVTTKEYRKSTFALVFFGEGRADIAYFYASQATTNKFSAQMLQINTRAVMEKVDHFERFWVDSLSMKETVNKLKECYDRYFSM